MQSSDSYNSQSIETHFNAPDQNSNGTFHQVVVIIITISFGCVSLLLNFKTPREQTVSNIPNSLAIGGKETSKLTKWVIGSRQEGQWHGASCHCIAVLPFHILFYFSQAPDLKVFGKKCKNNMHK